jgi:hypothetical protein
VKWGNVGSDPPEEYTVLRVSGKARETFHIQGVPGGKDLTSGECSLGQTIPI